MWANMAIEGGLSALKNGMAYRNAKQQAESARLWQTYKNTMTKISDGQNQNALTTNENLARERAKRSRWDIEKSEYLTTAEATVAAAASDTGGRSVNMVMFDIERNADAARAKVDRDLEGQRLQIDHQREASSFQAAMQMDYTPIPMPDATTYALGFATDMYKTYSRYNPAPKA